MKPIEIIEKWCKIAESKDIAPAKIAFWRIRDILEGTKVSKPAAMDAFIFLTQTRDSDEKTVLISAVRNLIGGLE